MNTVKIAFMGVSRWLVAGLLALSAVGCQGVVPQGGGFISPDGGASAVSSPGAASAQKKEEDAEAPPAEIPSDKDPSGSPAFAPPATSTESPSFAAPSPKPEYTVAAVDKPQTGGVSAIDPDPVDDEDGVPQFFKDFHYTFSGTVSPYCRGSYATVKYKTSGTIGARKWNGTDESLGGCEFLRVRFKTPGANASQSSVCTDLVMGQDCHFGGSVVVRAGEVPEIFVIEHNDVQGDACGGENLLGGVNPDEELEFLDIVPLYLPTCAKKKNAPSW